MPSSGPHRSAAHVRHGACLCSQVQFEVHGNPVHYLVCHCENCQRWSGSAFLSHYFLKPELVVVQQGQEIIKTFSDPNTNSGFPMMRSFCGECGSCLFMKISSEDFILVCASALDEKFDLDPFTELHADHKRPWVVVRTQTADPEQGST